MSLRSVILATATLCAYVADAHVVMKAPVPYSVDKIDNSPINKAQFPCKSQNGFTVSTMNTMAVGEKQTLTLSGSAVHGGGSCQLSVTLDTEPTASSVFKVIKSMEGGCPGVGTEAEAYDFTLPDSIPNGKATFAWTWFSKLSGGPELYMNCAPIEVTGGASDDSKFKELPNMLVANIDETCKSVPNFAVQFPDPGSVVQKGNTNDLKAPTGTGCGATGTTPADPSSPAGSGAPASSAAGGQASAAPSSAGGNDGMYTPPAGAATSAAASAAPSAAVSTPAAGSAAPSAATSKAAVTSAAATGGAGGVFAPGASSAAPAASTQTTLVTVTGTPATPVKSTAVASAPAASAPAAGTGTTPATPTTAPAASGDGTCSTEGAIVCNGTTQFGLCNQGKVVWQAVAAGTTCSNGTIQKRGYNGRMVRRNRGLVGHMHKH
ncbi:hypothetical protein EKO04_003101 [Ascochyta lentis]|uniref:Lytic polysaccharide monooxygenase n=1 Tax=Ascochyta lentis TaxID=205686 RepID=A0A8H7MFP9_9PLEO|nr:hypothetical protein EKO04_003101 [Ascochyta lentis]